MNNGQEKVYATKGHRMGQEDETAQREVFQIYCKFNTVQLTGKIFRKLERSLA